MLNTHYTTHNITQNEIKTLFKSNKISNIYYIKYKDYDLNTWIKRFVDSFEKTPNSFLSGATLRGWHNVGQLTGTEYKTVKLVVNTIKYNLLFINFKHTETIAVYIIK